MPEKVHSDHQALRSHFAELAEGVSFGKAAELLGILRAELPEHFAYEEKPGGFFDMIRDDAPRNLESIGRLVAEHRALETELDALGRLFDEARERLKTLGRHLTAHEEAEGDLLMDAEYLDLGTGD